MISLFSFRIWCGSLPSFWKLETTKLKAGPRESAVFDSPLSGLAPKVSEVTSKPQLATQTQTFRPPLSYFRRWWKSAKFALDFRPVEFMHRRRKHLKSGRAELSLPSLFSRPSFLSFPSLPPLTFFFIPLPFPPSLSSRPPKCIHGVWTAL